ncbi:SDR family NAD(P)-dependent oxidoreductase [Sneathiella sp. CAU 1612]|uniref:SDR family NAD(P)-dependent oxidoreductase n=1 Tax=Sneathiella sedimenti TaxID=2816034 RepID=A0ABS3F2R8_9PROT|nr:type I polyketide synthase [Sneathiella sedimenti]MBO0332806.1 SDR family NAD(P)-dependent oxidoreductase [Sneathiella sedimenti]
MTESNEGIQASERIAIVGMAGRFPSARSVAQLWNLLANERIGTRWFTDEEMLENGVSPKELANPNYVKAANYLSDMECFDAGFFGFSPREASILDPQHRHFLECAWEAFEDAGHMPENFDGRIGVFAGSGMQAYLPYNLLTNPDLVEEIGLFLLRHTGNDKDFLTTRLSYLLNLQGPSVAIQTACSTSLVAVHQAAASLLSMECDMAIAGGVTVELPHRHGYKFAEGEIQSPDGLCRPFDNDSEGTVFGSGAALVVLRRLEDALADGDDIKAVLIGSAVNNDGAQKAGYLAPSVDGQAEAAAEALAIAGVPAETVSYIEAHGTGTPVGDPIELAGLSQVYGEGGTGFCGIGSVKSNIGHLDTAAGTTSLIKVVEALRHEILPASLNYKTPNSRFDIANSPFYVVAETKPWPRGSIPRRAGINSLGVGGTNAHAIIEEAPLRPVVTHAESWRLFPFSARDRKALDGLQEKWRDFAASPEMPELADAAFTLRHGRREFSERRVLVAKSVEDLKAGLWNDQPDHVAEGSVGTGKAEVVFMFPGGGAQYPGAGAGLLASSDAFRVAVDECFAQMPADAPADLRSVMFEKTLGDAEARGKMEMSGYAIPALFVLEYAYATMFRSWGVEPAAVLGHSAGEYAGAVIARVMSVADALKIVVWRGKVMDAAAAGAMSIIPAPREKVSELIGDQLDIAALNAPDLCVVSGEVARIDALESELKGTEYEATRVRINVAAHSRILDDQLDNFRKGIQGIQLTEPEIPFVSTLRGNWPKNGDFSTIDYWVDHLRHTVRFADAIETVLQKPNRILLEVGPGQTLGPLAEMCRAENDPLAVISSGRPPKDVDDDMAHALVAAGHIWTVGGTLDWEKLPGAEGRRVSLPTYSFARDRHWIEPGVGGAVNAEDAESANAVHLTRQENTDDWFVTKSWKFAPIPPAEPRHGSHWLLFHGGDPVSDALVAELSERREDVIIVRPGDEFRKEAGGYRLAANVAQDYDALFFDLAVMPSHIIHAWPMAAAADGQEGLFDSAFCLARAIQSADPAEDLRLTFIGSGGFSVAGEPIPYPALGTLIGPVRVAPREVPGLSAQYIDLETAEDPVWAARAILDEQGGTTADDCIAFRGRQRYAQQLDSLPVTTSDALPKRVKEGGRYLITGGAGGIGLELAHYLGTAAKAKVALIGRKEMPDRREWEKVIETAPSSREAAALKTALAIEAAGGKLLYLSADVSDKPALSRALEKIKADIGGLDGVFHGAGIMDDAPMLGKSLEDTHHVLAPKVEGGENLSALLPPGKLDFFAVFSSTSVITAPPGQVDYVAANSYLESLAASRADGIAISWGVWRDVGMAARAYRSQEVGVAGAHPLLGPIETDDNGTLSFTCYYDPADLWVLAEHVVGGVPVLPGTAYIEIVRAAMEQAAPGRKWEIQSLSLLSPMIFPDGVRARVVVTLTPTDRGYDFQVQSSASAEAPLIEHCRANLMLKRLTDRKLPAGLQAPANMSVSENSGQDSQEELIDFGPRWDNVGEIRVGAQIVEADFALPEAYLADLETYAAHPGLTDTAATIGLNLLADVGTEGAFYAPMSIDRLRILRPLTPRFVARARLVAETPGRFASFDVVFSDEKGAPLMILEGFALSRVEGTSFDTARAPEQLVDIMIAQGIAAEDAPAVFRRVLNSDAKTIVVSPTSMTDIAREMARIGAQRRKKSDGARKEQAGSQTAYANSVEEKIAEFWSDLLGVDQAEPDADFFDLGGHSLAAVRLFAKIRKEYDTDLPLATLFQAPTLRLLSEMVISKGGIDIEMSAGSDTVTVTDSDSDWSPLVRIKKGAPQVKPLYLVHGAGGNVLNFRSLSGYIDSKIPFYALRALGSDGEPEIHETIEEMASCYVAAILKSQPEGPYNLAGYSGGGVIAFEMAQQLRAAGHEVGHLIFFDTLAPDIDPQPVSILEKIWTARHWSLGFALKWPIRKWQSRSAGREMAQIAELLAKGEKIPDELVGQRMTSAYLTAESRYRPADYPDDVLLFKGRQASMDFLRAGPHLGWDKFVSGNIEVMIFDCDHFNMMIDPTISEIGKILNELLLNR